MASALPYRWPLLEHLEKEYASGRKLVLATASPAKFARAIAEQLGFFLARGRGSNYVHGSAKACVTAFLTGFRQRLHPCGVCVLKIQPGYVDSPVRSYRWK
jgi:NAD(P)-dependent dehydrogenase (short-subunit alcohol dehydrogenase family)